MTLLYHQGIRLDIAAANTRWLAGFPLLLIPLAVR